MPQEKGKSEHELLGEIHDLLQQSITLMDRAAHLCKPAGLSRDSVKEIASGMQWAMSVQHEIYKQRPDLMPDYLKRDAPGMET